MTKPRTSVLVHPPDTHFVNSVRCIPVCPPGGVFSPSSIGVDRAARKVTCQLYENFRLQESLGAAITRCFGRSAQGKTAD